jgi:hypothetical protein
MRSKLRMDSLFRYISEKLNQYKIVFAISFFLIVLEFSLFFLMNYYIYGTPFKQTNFKLLNVPFDEIAGNRAPLAFMANNLFSYLLGPYIGVPLLHLLLSLVCFFANAFILVKVIPNPRWVLVYCLIYLTNFLFHREIIGFYDTSLFAAALSLFLLIACSNVSFYKRCILLAIFGAVGWYTRTTGVLFISMIIGVILFDSRVTFKPRCVGLSVSLLTFFLLILPLQVYNFSKTGAFSISPAPNNGFHNSIKGNNYLAYQGYPYVDLDIIDYNSYYQQRNYEKDDIALVSDLYFSTPQNSYFYKSKK